MSNRRFLFIVIVTLAAFSLTAQGRPLSKMTVKDRLNIAKTLSWDMAEPHLDVSVGDQRKEALSTRRRMLIRHLRRLLSSQVTPKVEAELLFRLGKAYREEGEAFFLSKNKSGKEVARVRQSFLRHSARTFGKFVTQFPKHESIDAGLMNLGICLQGLGKIDKAIVLFQRIIDDFPRSSYRAQALVEVGDHWFTNNAAAKAARYYDEVMRLKGNPAVTYARYKRAWCYYNEGNFQKSISLFKQIIEDGSNPGGQALAIREEALKDVLLPFVELREKDEAVEFFKGFGEKRLRAAMEMMAPMLLDVGERQMAISVWEDLIKMNPAYSQAPFYDIQIIEACQREAKDAEVLRRLVKLPDTYARPSRWFRANSSDTDQLKQVWAKIEDLIRVHANNQFAVVEKMNSEAHYGAARKLYSLYLEKFSDFSFLPLAECRLARLHFRQEEFDEAADMFFNCFQHADGPLREEALENSINALRKQAPPLKQSGLSVDPWVDGEAPKGDPPDYSRFETKFLAIALAYLTEFPEGPQAPSLIYDVTFIHWKRGRTQEAKQGFLRLIRSHPKARVAQAAALHLLEIFSTEKNFKDLVQVAGKLLRNKAMASPSFRKTVSGILRRGELKLVAQLEEQSKHREAAEAYLAYARKYGKEEVSLHEQAIYNASVAFFQAGDFVQSARTKEAFLRELPKSSMRGKVLLELGRAFERLADFEKSGVYFEKFAKENPKDVSAPAALRLAGVYAWATGEESLAEELLTLGLGRYLRNRDQWLEELIRLFVSSGKEKRLAHFLRKEIRAVPKSSPESLVLRVRLAESNGISQEESQKIWQQVSRDFGKTSKGKLASLPRGKWARSKLALREANQKFSEFVRVRLDVPQAKVEAAVKVKLKHLRDLERKLLSVARIGSENDPVEATYKAALAHSLMAESVGEAPVPSRLSPQQLEIYRNELRAGVIEPLREKAMELVSQCLDTERDEISYSDWTSHCYALASRLAPERFPSFRSYYLPAVRVALGLPDFEEDRERLALQFPSASLQLGDLAPRRTLASSDKEYPDFDERYRALPLPFDYRSDAERLRAGIAEWIEKKGGDGDAGASLEYLAMLRLQDPKRVIKILKGRILTEPDNYVLTNLLATTYAESGKRVLAKALWNSLLERNCGEGEVIRNNLGVLSVLEGDERQARKFFESAIGTDRAEPLSNLAALALKARDGEGAHSLFERLLSARKSDLFGRLGMAMAQIQQGQISEAGEALSSLASDYEEEPLVQVSAATLLLDAHRDGPGALKILSRQVAEADSTSPLVRRVIHEAKSTFPETSPDPGEVSPSNEPSLAMPLLIR